VKLTPLHERLLADILDLGSPYPLVLTGGYAVQAHGLVERFSRDLDVATENPNSRPACPGVQSRPPLTCTKQAGSRQTGVQSAAYSVQVQDLAFGCFRRSGP
jgi:hypothetical protein